MAAPEFTKEDEGKRVVAAGGDEIGIISHVESGRGYVDFEPSLFDKIQARMGFDDVSETYPLDPGEVDEITDDGVFLAPRRESAER
ncbi:PRC-barrel domain containing protein (plasmid) [Haloferacaceae archaeon DSL9]